MGSTGPTNDCKSDQALGGAVALSGDTALIFAGNVAIGTSSVYIFVRSGTAWTQQAVITSAIPNNAFGVALTIDGDTAVIGASFQDNATGAVYMYRRNGSVWTQEAEFDGTIEYNYFGDSVSVSGNTAVVSLGGSAANGDNPAHRGAAYVYKRTGTTWAEEAKLTPPDDLGRKGFASSVVWPIGRD